MLITLVPISTQIQMPTDSHPPSPNIIFIVSDDAGYSDFGFQGSDDIETPNLDALCASGVRFEQAYVTASVCSPSRAGLITGRYQQRIGYEHNIPVGGPHGLPGDTITIADRLQEARYTTSAI
ncbi:MAG: sulfatase-like hydrolase/transferase, partial [Phycisphaerae bacterium]|nr:sulfatase-like hydrolase/transferase [Phycisphaerae bacterium]